jgi:predicted porin
VKKQAIGAAVLGFVAMSASAQSQVTLYGVVDTGVEVANGGAGTQVRETNNSLYASRWGLTGAEDLGGGVRAIFKLENGFLPNNGTAVGGLLFGRESWVGLSGGFGSVRFGVNYTPLHDMETIYGPRGFGSGLSWGNSTSYFLFTPLVRASNSVDYRSPSFHGVTFRAFYALGTNGGATAGLPRTLGNTGSLMLNYQAGPVGLNATWLNQRYSTPTAGQPLTAQTPTFAGNYYAFGAYYDFGCIRPSVMWTMHRNGNSITTASASSFANPTNNQLEVGAQIPVTAFGMLLLDYGRYSMLGHTGGDAQAYTVRFDYALSKRTTVYAGAAYVRNGALTAFSPTGIGSPGPTTLAGHNVTSVLSGITQRF